MLDGSFDVVTAIRDLAVELDVLRRRVRLLEDAVAGLQAAEPAGEEPTSAGSVGPAGRKSGKREKTVAASAAGASVVTDDAADAG